MKNRIKSARSPVWRASRWAYRTFLSRWAWANRLAVYIVQGFSFKRFDLVDTIPDTWKHSPADPPEQAMPVAPAKTAAQADWLVLRKVRVFHHSRLIAKGQQAYLPMLSNDALRVHLDTYRLQEEASGHLVVDFARNHVRAASTRNADLIIEEPCLSLIGPFSQNWMHWLTEAVPVMLAARRQLNVDFCVLIEKSCPAQIKETVRFLFPERKIIEIDSPVAATCDALLHYTKSQINWSMFWPRRHKNIVSGAFGFDAETLRQTRADICGLLAIPAAPPTRKIFVRRNSKFRVITNQDQIEAELVARGFAAVDPSAMSFAEQVACFSQARVVVGQAGAGLANLMFMQPGTKIVALISDNAFVNRDYFADYARIFGVDLSYAVGKITRNRQYRLTRQPHKKHLMNAVFDVPVAAICERLDHAGL